MKHKEQKFYFYNLVLDKESKKKITLDDILKKYLETEVEKEINLKKDEKKIELIEVKTIEENKKYILKYEIFKYGKKKKIKNIDTKKEEGVLEKRHCVEEYQYVCLNKINNDSFDVVLQGKVVGVKHNQFYTIICDFYSELKKELSKNIDNEELGDTMLRIYTYHHADFLKKIEDFNINRVDVVTNVDSNLVDIDIDEEFAKRFDLSAKLSFNIIKNGIIFDSKVDIVKYMKNIKEKYPDAKMIIKGLNKKQEKDKILSDEMSYSKTKKVQINDETNEFKDEHLEEVLTLTSKEFSEDKKITEYIIL
ncbi:MAG: hypothetical protein RSB50_07045 [Cetobacterium sp.]